MCIAIAHVCFGTNSGHQHLFDDFVARASTAGGIGRPSALAVLRLMTKSVLIRRLHRQIGRLLSSEDAIYIAGPAKMTSGR